MKRTSKPALRRDAEQAAIRRMADEGLLTPPSRKGPMPSPRWRPVKIEGKPLSQTIIEDREDRF
jgi:hypothetical protein